MFTPQFLRGISALLPLLFSFSLLFSQSGQYVTLTIDLSKAIGNVKTNEDCYREPVETTFKSLGYSMIYGAWSVLGRYDRETNVEFFQGNVRGFCKFEHAIFYPDGKGGAMIFLDEKHFEGIGGRTLTSLQKTLIVYHEVAHLILDHHKIAGGNIKEMEKQADWLSGLLLGRGITYFDQEIESRDIKKAMLDLYKDTDENHAYLSGKERARLVHEAFNKARNEHWVITQFEECEFLVKQGQSSTSKHVLKNLVNNHLRYRSNK